MGCVSCSFLRSNILHKAGCWCHLYFTLSLPAGIPRHNGKGKTAYCSLSRSRCNGKPTGRYTVSEIRLLLLV